MEFSATIEYGPLNAEVKGGEREQIEEEVLGFIEFIEENSDKIDGIEIHSGGSGGQDGPGNSTNGAGGGSSHSYTDGSAEKFEAIAQRARTDAGTITQFLNYPDDDDKVPYLSLDVFEEEEEILGSSRREKQARASLMLLYLWQEVGGVEEVESANLNTALQTSRISPKSRKNMYKALDGEADSYFSRDNQGNVGLKQAGEITAVDQITDLAEKLSQQETV